MKRLATCVAMAATMALPRNGSAAPETSSDGPPRVEARLVGDSAMIKARFAIAVTEIGLAVQSLTFVVPVGAVVTAGTVTIGGATHALVLRNADEVRAKFESLRKTPGHDSPWAILVASDAESVTVDIAAPRTGKGELTLELEAPTCFSSGARWVQLPEGWKTEHAVSSPATCPATSNGPWLSFASTRVEAQPSGEDRVASIGGRLELPIQHVARVELDLARHLADIPHDLRTAIVIDASRSVDPALREIQREVVASYLRNVPHTDVQVIAYSRIARPLLASWQLTDVAATRIDRELRALPARNGSNLDAGLTEAGLWLARVHGTRRAIVFTDELVAERLRAGDAAELAKLVPAGTLVHVVALRAGKGALDRDDAVLFAALAAATEGMGVSAEGHGTGVTNAELLARPRSLDHVEIQGTGWDVLSGASASCDLAPIAAGDSCVWWGIGGATAGPIRVEGQTWGHKVVRIIRPDRARGRSMARELSSAMLDDALRLEVDRAASAVNKVWSLFATWGGNGGYSDVAGFGSGAWGHAGTHHTSTIVDTIESSKKTPPIDLKNQLSGPIAACELGAVHVDIDVELTLQEIVGVTVDVHGADRTLHDCIVEAVWNTVVVVPDAPSHAHARVTI